MFAEYFSTKGATLTFLALSTFSGFGATLQASESLVSTKAPFDVSKIGSDIFQVDGSLYQPMSDAGSNDPLQSPNPFLTLAKTLPTEEMCVIPAKDFTTLQGEQFLSSAQSSDNPVAQEGLSREQLEAEIAKLKLQVEFLNIRSEGAEDAQRKAENTLWWYKFVGANVSGLNGFVFIVKHGDKVLVMVKDFVNERLHRNV